MPNRTYTFRLTSEGMAELQKDFVSLGDQGEAALHKLEAAAPGFGAAMEASAKRADAARQKLLASTQQQLSDIASLLDNAVRTSEQNFQNLHASLDPAVAAQQQFARGQATVTDALKRGATTEAEAVQVKKLLQQQLERNTAGLGGYSTGLTTATRLLGTFGIAISVGQIISWGTAIEHNTAQLVDQAKQLQVSTDALQANRAEFAQNGSTAEDADKALRKVNETIGNSVDNVAGARRQLSEWNLDWKELASVAPDQRLGLIAKGLLSIEDGTRRARAEQAIFGKTGSDVESVLEGLAEGIDKVISRQKQLGTIKTNQTALEAKAAADTMTQAFQQLETQAAPAIVKITQSLTGLTLILKDLADPNKGLAGVRAAGSLVDVLSGGFQIEQPARLASGYDGTEPLPRNPDGSVKYYQFPKTAAGTAASSASSNYSTYLAGLQTEANLAGLTAQKRAEGTALITAANEKLKDGVVYQGKITDFAGRQATSLGDALKILNPTEQAEVRRLAAQKQGAEYADRLKNTYAKFLADEQESARVAGETVAQRNTELAVIQGAQVLQKQRGVQEKDLVQTYAQAKKILGDIRTAEVEAAEATKSRNELARDILTPLRDEVSLAGQTRDAREAELEVLRLKQQYGATAVSQSEDELRNLLKQRDVMEGDDLIADYRERAQLSAMSADDAEREAAVLQAIHATHGNLTDDQAAQIRALATQEQDSRRILDTAGQVQDVIANWAETGHASLSDLTNVFKRTLAQMTAQALLNPIILPIVGAISGVGGFGGTSPLALGSSAGGGGFGAGGLMQLGMMGGDSLGLGGIGASISSGIAGIGSALGFSAGAGAGTSVALGTIPGIGAGAAPISLGSISSATPALPGSVFGMTTLGQFAGGVGLGSLAGQLVFGNKNDASMGSMGGAAAGALAGTFLFPGVGTVLGGLIGGLAGGGLGSMTGSSNQGAIANFGSDGTSSYLFKQGGGNNGKLATQAASEVSAVISALKAQGVTVSLGNVTGLSIGADKSYVYGADGMKEKLGGGDVEGVVSSILSKVLPSATGGNSDAQAILAHYQQNGGVTKDNLSQLTSDLGFANTLQNIDFGAKQLNQSEQALKQINDQYQQLIDKAQALGLETGKIETARQSAIQTLIDNFNDGVSSAIQQIQDPMAAASAALSAQQKQRIEEATALGADLTQVYALNALETKNLTDAMNAQAAAMANQVSDFNENIRIGTLGFTDALGAALAAEDNAGQQRIDQAKQLGADLVAVEKYNALNRQKIADDYAAQAKAAADQAAQTAAAEMAQMTQTINAAKGNLAALVSDLTAGDASGLSPDRKYFTLLTQYTDAVRQAQSNPNDAASIIGFQSAASNLIPAAREFLGTSESYNRLSSDILANATRLGGDLADPSGIGRAMVEATAQGSGAIVDAISLTNSGISSMDDKITRLAALLQAFVNRAA